MSSSHAGIWSNEVTKNRFVWLALLLCFLLIFLVYLFPQTHVALHLSVISIDAWMVAVFAGLLPLIVVQCYKIIWIKRNAKVLSGEAGPIR